MDSDDDPWTDVSADVNGGNVVFPIELENILKDKVDSEDAKEPTAEPKVICKIVLDGEEKDIESVPKSEMVKLTKMHAKSDGDHVTEVKVICETVLDTDSEEEDQETKNKLDAMFAAGLEMYKFIGFTKMIKGYMVSEELEMASMYGDILCMPMCITEDGAEIFIMYRVRSGYHDYGFSKKFIRTVVNTPLPNEAIDIWNTSRKDSGLPRVEYGLCLSSIYKLGPNFPDSLGKLDKCRYYDWRSNIHCAWRKDVDLISSNNVEYTDTSFMCSSFSKHVRDVVNGFKEKYDGPETIRNMIPPRKSCEHRRYYTKCTWCGGRGEYVEWYGLCNIGISPVQCQHCYGYTKPTLWCATCHPDDVTTIRLKERGSSKFSVSVKMPLVCPKFNAFPKMISSGTVYENKDIHNYGFNVIERLKQQKKALEEEKKKAQEEEKKAQEEEKKKIATSLKSIGYETDEDEREEEEEDGYSDSDGEDDSDAGHVNSLSSVIEDVSYLLDRVELLDKRLDYRTRQFNALLVQYNKHIGGRLRDQTHK